jgi:hypothetical protein
MSCSEYDAQRVREELARDERVGELGIEVTISGDHAFLRGKVSNTERKQVIADVAQELLPECTVVNEVTIIEMDEPHLESLG